MNKTCSSCQEVKNVGEFYAHPDGFLGVMHICKLCHRVRMKIRALTNPAVQEYDKKRAKRPDRKAKSAQIVKAFRATKPEAYKAHNAANNALRDGKLQRQPCAMCGTWNHVHKHHSDYREPLKVTWLCAKCHHRAHAIFPEIRGHVE